MMFWQMKKATAPKRGCNRLFSMQLWNVFSYACAPVEYIGILTGLFWMVQTPQGQTPAQMPQPGFLLCQRCRNVNRVAVKKLQQSA